MGDYRCLGTWAVRPGMQQQQQQQQQLQFKMFNPLHFKFKPPSRAMMTTGLPHTTRPRPRAH